MLSSYNFRSAVCFSNRNISDIFTLKKILLYAKQEYQNDVHSLGLQGENDIDVNKSRKT